MTETTRSLRVYFIYPVTGRYPVKLLEHPVKCIHDSNPQYSIMSATNKSGRLQQMRGFRPQPFYVIIETFLRTLPGQLVYVAFGNSKGIGNTPKHIKLYWLVLSKYAESFHFGVRFLLLSSSSSDTILFAAS